MVNQLGLPLIGLVAAALIVALLLGRFTTPAVKNLAVKKLIMVLV